MNTAHAFQKQLKQMANDAITLWREGVGKIKDHKILTFVASFCILLDGVTTFVLLSFTDNRFIEGNVFAATAMNIVGFHTYIFVGHALTLFLTIPIIVNYTQRRGLFQHLLFYGAVATIVGKGVVGCLNIMLFLTS